MAADLTEQADTEFQFVNIGGGYGIPYFPGEQALNLGEVCSALGNSISQYRSRLGKARIVIELGRFLVGEAGYYVCRVSDIKESQGQIFVMVDGGLHHHLSNSGNFGQVLRKNYPVVIGTRMDDATRATLNIVGPLCTPLDIVADSMQLPMPDIGDLVVVMQSGAYGFTASPQLFLGHPLPQQILV